MISVTEAKGLYKLPPYTDDEIELQIRNKAGDQSYTCFDTHRITNDQIAELQRCGFRVDTGADTVQVSWK